MFRIKICGLTSAEDAERAVSCGADAVGLNFFRGSPRFVGEEAARRIVEAVGSRAEVVAVFVDEDPGEIAAVCGRLGIRRVQLHGREPAEASGRIRLWRMKAVHAALPVEIDALRSYPCEAFLLDAGGPGEYGGTGKRLPWRELPSRFGTLGKPWILAGGLTPENVERAIVEAAPFGVDTASGVESSPGRKDPDKMAAFVENAKKGFLRAGG
ncbi:MAG: phosphoribosylanthranilate isomerase [Thermodesulfobacteriota bacterium]